MTSSAPPEPALRSDGELLQRFLESRDQHSLTDLVTRHAALVRGVCQRLLGNSPDADDAFQATFLVLVRKGERIRRPESLAAWLYGVAHRIARRQRHERSRTVAVLKEEHAMIAPDPLAELATRHDVALFDAELARLPEKYRAPIVLHHLEGKSQREVAAELKLTEGAVDGLLKRGRNELRLRLARRGVVFGATILVLEQSQHAVAATSSQPLIAATMQNILSFDPVLSPELPRTPSARLAQQEITTMGLYHAGKVTAWTIAASLLLGAAGLGLSAGRNDFSLGTPGLIASELDATDAAADAVVAVAAGVSSAEKETFSGNVTFTNNTLENVTDRNSSVQEAEADSVSLTPADFRPSKLSEDPIVKALAEQTEVSFAGTRLSDALKLISNLHKFNVFVPDDPGNGLTTDIAVDLDVSGISLRSVLKLMLEPHALDYIIQDGEMKIISRQAADNYHEMRIYQLDGLGGLAIFEMAERVEALVKDNVGGQWKKPGTSGSGGTVQWTPNGLVVRHNQRIHLAVEQFLNQLNYEVAGEKTAAAHQLQSSGNATTGTGNSNGQSGTTATSTSDQQTLPVQFRRLSPAEEKIYKAFQERTEFSFVDSPLRDALNYVEDLHQFEVLIDEQGITDEGLSADVRINLEISGVQLKSALNRLLAPHHLDYVIQDEVLMVTSSARAEALHDLRIYNVDGLPPLIDKAYRTNEDFPQKMESAFKKAVGGEWDGTDSKATHGTLQWTPAGLVVRTNQRMHAEIEKFLQQLRRADGQGE